MFDWIFLAIALIGTGIAGWIDLKTTEIPDWIPFSMIGGGLILHIIQGLVTASWTMLFWALAVAAGFAAFGYLLYYTGMWGEADVLILAAIGVLIPQPLSMFNLSVIGAMFPLTFLLNSFIVGGVYSILYAIILAAKTPAVFSSFFTSVKGSAKGFLAVVVLTALGCIFLFLSITSFYSVQLPMIFLFRQFLILIPLIVCLFLLYKFAMVVDKVAFRKQIPTKNLREGDVLAEEIKSKKFKMSGKLFVGLEKAQIKKIQKIKNKVWIKEGIRYGFVFFLTILVTWFFGNVMFWIFGITI